MYIKPSNQKKGFWSNIMPHHHLFSVDCIALYCFMQVKFLFHFILSIALISN